MIRAMVVKGLLIILLMVALVAVTGCGEKEKPQSKAGGVSKEDVNQETKEAYEAIKAYTQEQSRPFGLRRRPSSLSMIKKLINYRKALKSWSVMRK